MINVIIERARKSALGILLRSASSEPFDERTLVSYNSDVVRRVSDCFRQAAENNGWRIWSDLLRTDIGHAFFRRKNCSGDVAAEGDVEFCGIVPDDMERKVCVEVFGFNVNGARQAFSFSFDSIPVHVQPYEIEEGHYIWSIGSHLFEIFLTGSRLERNTRGRITLDSLARRDSVRERYRIARFPFACRGLRKS